MKRKHLTTLAIIIPFLICCSKEVNIMPSYEATLVERNDASFVSLKQVEGYASHCYPDIRSDGGHSFTIEPVTGDNSDTLMYVINFGQGDGWKIISADNRTPAVIAESETGSFVIDSDNISASMWLDCIAKDLSLIRRSETSQLSFSTDQISSNIAFWGGNTINSLDPISDEGHWGVSTTSEEIIVEEVEHMTPKWDQYHDYNLFCPLKSNSTTERVPAGCVAVAGAEMLYFLHNHFGVPATMVSEGYCYGNVNNYSQSFYSENSTIWASMSSGYSPTLSSPYAEALMIGHVGAQTGMHYNNGYSWTLPANLRTAVFNPLGISCSHGSYNASTVKSNLNNGLPVIVTATDMLIPADFDIHCFIIDGYRKSYTKYTHYHYYIPDDPNYVPTPGVNESYYTYTYSSTDITAIKINWGWWSQWDPNYLLNDGWYSLTDDWYTITSNGREATYNYNRQMIYGFSINN